MNDLIYKISLLADQYAHGICDGNEHADWYQTRDQKFAELIIEECGDVAYRAFWDNPETVRGIHIKQKIKEHFGVE